MSAMVFAAIPAWTHEGKAPSIYTFFEAIALAGLEEQRIRLDAGTQRALLGFPVFVNQRPIVSSCQRPNLSSWSGRFDWFLPLLEAIGIVASFEYFAVMSDAVEQGGRHLWIAEHGHPFTE